MEIYMPKQVEESTHTKTKPLVIDGLLSDKTLSTEVEKQNSLKRDIEEEFKRREKEDEQKQSYRQNELFSDWDEFTKHEGKQNIDTSREEQEEPEKENKNTFGEISEETLYTSEETRLTSYEQGSKETAPKYYSDSQPSYCNWWLTNRDNKDDDLKRSSNHCCIIL